MVYREPQGNDQIVLVLRRQAIKPQGDSDEHSHTQQVRRMLRNFAYEPGSQLALLTCRSRG